MIGKPKSEKSSPDLNLKTHSLKESCSKNCKGMKTITIPIRLVSEGNLRDHWTKKMRRKQEFQSTILYFLNPLEKPTLPCKIVLTRIAPRELDEDNLWTSMKGVIDVIADWLIPGLAPGRADGDKRLAFHCSQKKGNVREYALEIEFRSL